MIRKVLNIYTVMVALLAAIGAMTFFNLPPLMQMDERRELAEAPGVPTDIEALAAFPEEMSAFVADQFYGREVMVWLSSQIHVRALNTSPRSNILFGSSGYWFLSGGEDADELSGFQSACGLSEPAGYRRNRLTERAAAILESHPDVRLTFAFIPTKLDVFRDKLNWPHRSICEGGNGHVAKVYAADLAEALGEERVFYPHDQVQGWQPILYPRRFHWARGDNYVEQYRSALIEQLGVQSGSADAYASRTITIESDFGNQIPGIPIAYEIDQMFWQPSAGDTRCLVSECLPGLAEAGKLRPGSRNGVYTRNDDPALTKRVIVVGDSFVAGFEEMLSASYAEAIYINIKPVRDQEAAWAWMINEFQPDDIIMLIHDGSSDVLWHFLPEPATLGIQPARPSQGRPVVNADPVGETPAASENQDVAPRQGNAAGPNVREGVFERVSASEFRFSPNRDAVEGVIVPAGLSAALEGDALVIAGAPARMMAGGKTSGVSFAVSREDEVDLSGRTVEVAVELSGPSGSTVNIAYSTADVGNSGWQSFNLTGAERQTVRFRYDVPELERGFGDFIGIVPPTDGELSVYSVSLTVR